MPIKQVIYVHKTYGDVWIEDANGGPTVTFTFTALGGKMQSSSMGAFCSAGYFGYFYLTMEHQ